MISASKEKKVRGRSSRVVYGATCERHKISENRKIPGSTTRLFTATFWLNLGSFKLPVYSKHADLVLINKKTVRVLAIRLSEMCSCLHVANWFTSIGFIFSYFLAGTRIWSTRRSETPWRTGRRQRWPSRRTWRRRITSIDRSPRSKTSSKASNASSKSPSCPTARPPTSSPAFTPSTRSSW